MIQVAFPKRGIDAPNLASIERSFCPFSVDNDYGAGQMPTVVSTDAIQVNGDARSSPYK
jgi:hypothetical protein